MNDIEVNIVKHDVDVGQMRAILKNHKPVEVKCWLSEDGESYEYIILKFSLVGTKFTFFSTHNYPWEEDTNVDWKQFIIDARLKGVSTERKLSIYKSD